MSHRRRYRAQGKPQGTESSGQGTKELDQATANRELETRDRTQHMTARERKRGRGKLDGRGERDG